MQADRASTRAMKLTCGLFGAERAKAVSAADPDRRETNETEEPLSGLKHLFGR